MKYLKIDRTFQNVAEFYIIADRMQQNLPEILLHSKILLVLKLLHS